MKLKHTDWELKYWLNGTEISAAPVGEHLGEEPQVDLQCDPRTGAFWPANTDENGETDFDVFFSAQTAQRYNIKHICA